LLIIDMYINIYISMKFFHTDLSACHAGLSHQMSNFNTLIRFNINNDFYQIIKDVNKIIY